MNWPGGLVVRENSLPCGHRLKTLHHETSDCDATDDDPAIWLVDCFVLARGGPDVGPSAELDCPKIRASSLRGVSQSPSRFQSKITSQLPARGRFVGLDNRRWQRPPDRVAAGQGANASLHHRD